MACPQTIYRGMKGGFVAVTAGFQLRDQLVQMSLEFLEVLGAQGRGRLQVVPPSVDGSAQVEVAWIPHSLVRRHE